MVAAIFLVLLPLALKSHRHDRHDHHWDKTKTAAYVTALVTVSNKWEHVEQRSKYKFPSQIVNYFVEFEDEYNEKQSFPVPVKDYIDMEVGQKKYLTVRDGSFFSLSDTPPSKQELDAGINPDAGQIQEHSHK